MAGNKVTFGLSNVHIGKYEVGTNGAVTLGTPMALPGDRKSTRLNSSHP